MAAGTTAAFSSWWEFKAAFISRFAPLSLNEQARNRLDRLVQTRSASAYADQYNILMLQLPHMETHDRIHNFIRGLKPALRLQVQLQNPQSLDVAFAMAIAADDMMFRSSSYGAAYPGSSSGFGSRRYRSSYGNPPAGTAGSPMELGSMQHQQQQPQQYAQQRPNAAPYHVANISSSRPYCSFCRIPGHWTRDCRRRQGKAHQRGPGSTGQHQ